MLIKLLASIFLVISTLLSITCNAADITWHVINRFPVFVNADDFTKLENNWHENESAEEFLSHQNGESLRSLLPIKKTWWNPELGSYSQNLLKRDHTILVKYIGDKQDKKCNWYLNSQPKGQDLCSAEFKIENVVENKAFTLSVQPELSEMVSLENQTIKSEIIIGLGDSFASGEGNPDYATQLSKNPEFTSIDGLDWFLRSDKGYKRFDKSAEWWDQACHRSLLSWQSMFAMQRAINNRQSVIKFASFACSGAEIYDGFFHAQQTPPGILKGQITPGVITTANTNGGSIYEKSKIKNNIGQLYSPPIEKSHSSHTTLVKSQLNASLELLCDGTYKDASIITKYRDPVPGLDSKVLYGDFETGKCDGDIRKPDLILLSFGGNDFNFGSVVRWALIPNSVQKKVDYIPRKAGLIFVRQVLKVTDPIAAGLNAHNNLSNLYSDLDKSIKNTLKVDDKKTTIEALVYPDPLPKSDFTSCSARLSVGNESLGQVVKDRGLKGWTFSIEEPQTVKVRHDFIEPLRTSQAVNIKALGWEAVDAQAGFTLQNRSICSVSSSCTKQSCSQADFYGWQDKESLPYLKNTTEWEAYSANQSRGLRTANDAVMTQAVFDNNKNGTINNDWLSGSCHPTAAVHATIATELQKNYEKKPQQMTNAR